jgi:transposase
MLRHKTHKALKKEGKERRFKAIRFLLYRDSKTLNSDEKPLIKDYLRLNKELKEVYSHCEVFKAILKTTWKSRQDASIALTYWMGKARKSLPHFVKTLENWWDMILNACLSSLSNGRAEGLNNKKCLLTRMLNAVLACELDRQVAVYWAFPAHTSVD